MNVSLTQELSDFVAAEVDAGAYQSASEVVRDALRLLRREKDLEAAKLELLRRHVGRGLKEAEAGEFSTRSLDELAEEALRDETVPA